MSVRLKLTLWGVLVLAVALLASGGMLRYQVQRDTMRSLDADLYEFCTMVRDRATGRGPGGGPNNHGGPGPRGPEQGGADPRGFGGGGWGGPGRPDDGGRGQDGPPPSFGDGPPPNFGDGPGSRGFNGNRSFPNHNFGVEPRSNETDGSPRPRARAFDVSGASLSGDATQTAWDGEALKRALQTNREVYSAVTVNGDPQRVLTLPFEGPDGKVQGAVQAARSLSDLKWVIDRLTGTLLLFIPVCLVLAGVGGAFTASRALRPVRQITLAASRMRAEDLTARLPENGGDEFAQLAHTFNDLFARLESAFEQQRRFTADASHELRTPLAALKIQTSLALQGERNAAQYRDALVAADRSADTATRIVTDLLLLSRSDNERLGLRLAPTHLIGSLLEAVERIEAVETAPPPIEVLAPDSSLRVLGDAHHLTRLFTNLLENAARHTPQTGRIRVTAEKATTGSAVVVEIEDNGEGIGREHLPHVRERFYRADASRTRASGGTGLGLAICQSIVDAHHGMMEIKSERGAGTHVRITLPLAPPGLATGSSPPPTVHLR